MDWNLCRLIYDATQMGVRPSAIAKYYNMPKSTVSNIIRRYESRFGDTALQQKRQGRPQKLDSEGLCRFEQIMVAHRFLPLRSITAIFNASGTVSLSARSVRRYSKLIGFRNSSAVRKPFIREANLMKRTEWAVRHHNWDMTQWSRVVFTDESSFEVRPLKRNMRCWRRVNERFDPTCTVPTYKSGNELVNV